MIINDIPGHAAFVLRRLTEAGHKAYLVGGCVRDAVMGRKPHDWDVATSARTDEVTRLFTKTVLTGARFGGVTVVFDDAAPAEAAPAEAAPAGAEPVDAAPAGAVAAGAAPVGAAAAGAEPAEAAAAEALVKGTVEVTTFRTDGTYSDSRRPDSVEFVSDIEADLSRRDFTVNAMAAGRDGRVIDPFGGIGDIAVSVIRCVGDPLERFSEDALRMFRAFRFSAELGFSIEPDTLYAIGIAAPKAQHISAERIRAELEKTIMSGKPWVAGDIIEAGLLVRFLQDSRQKRAPRPEAPKGGEPQCNVQQKVVPQFDVPQKDVKLTGECSLSESFEKLAALPEEPAIRWCAFCAVLLDFACISSAADFLRSLRLDVKTISCCSEALTIISFPNDKVGIKRLLAEHGVDAVRCAAASIGGTDTLSEADDVISSGECFSLRDLALNGDDLVKMGYAQGREIGETLGKLLNHVIDHPDDNIPEALIKLL